MIQHLNQFDARAVLEQLNELIRQVNRLSSVDANAATGLFRAEGPAGSRWWIGELPDPNIVYTPTPAGETPIGFFTPPTLDYPGPPDFEPPAGHKPYYYDSVGTLWLWDGSAWGGKLPGSYKTLIGDGVATSFTVTQAEHGLAADGTLLVGVFDDATGDLVQPTVSIDDATGDVTISFAAAPATDEYRVVIVGGVAGSSGGGGAASAGAQYLVQVSDGAGGFLAGGCSDFGLRFNQAGRYCYDGTASLSSAGGGGSPTNDCGIGNAGLFFFSGNETITGFDITSGGFFPSGQPYRRFTIVCTNGAVVTLKHNNTGSAAVNRILTPNAGDYNVGTGTAGAGAGVDLVWVDVTQRWVVLAPK